MTREEMVGILSIHCDNGTCEHCPIYGYADFECTFGKLSVSQLTTLIERLHGERRAEDSGATPNEEVASAVPDNVNHPKHYELPGGLECIDVLLATQGKDFVMGFCLCNAMKYLYRHKRKNGVEDIKKARWYIDKYLELEGKHEDHA